MPGRNDVTVGSGGDDINSKPATASKAPETRGSATHPDATKLVMTARESALDSQQLSESHEARGISEQQRIGQERCQRIRMVRGAGQRKSKPGRHRVHFPERSRKQRPVCSTSSATQPDASSETQQPEQRVGDGALRPIRTEPKSRPGIDKTRAAYFAHRVQPNRGIVITRFGAS